MACFRLRSAKSLAACFARLTRSSQAFGTTSNTSAVRYPLQISSVSENHAAVYNESLNNPDAFWGHLARSRLSWMKGFDRVMDCDMKAGRLNWFGGGKLNVTGKTADFKVAVNINFNNNKINYYSKVSIL